MKKFFVMAVMAVAALNANAQWWAGGELGFGSSHNNGAEVSTKEFTIKPEVGYSLTDKIDVALSVGYIHLSNASLRDYVNENYGFDLGRLGVRDGSGNGFTINPYIRYKFVKAGNFFAFVDGGIDYTTLHMNGTDKNANQFGVSVAPGIAYAVSPKVTLVSHIGDGLYYRHSWIKDTAHNNAFGFKLINSISFGAYYSF